MKNLGASASFKGIAALVLLVAGLGIAAISVSNRNNKTFRTLSQASIGGGAACPNLKILRSGQVLSASDTIYVGDTLVYRGLADGLGSIDFSLNVNGVNSSSYSKSVQLVGTQYQADSYPVTVTGPDDISMLASYLPESTPTPTFTPTPTPIACTPQTDDFSTLNPANWTTRYGTTSVQNIGGNLVLQLVKDPTLNSNIVDYHQTLTNNFRVEIDNPSTTLDANLEIYSSTLTYLVSQNIASNGTHSVRAGTYTPSQGWHYSATIPTTSSSNPRFRIDRFGSTINSYVDLNDGTGFRPLNLSGTDSSSLSLFISTSGTATFDNFSFDSCPIAPTATPLPTLTPTLTPTPTVTPTPSPVAVNCDAYTPSWSISSVVPSPIISSATPSFTVQGNFPHIQECGRNLLSLFYVSMVDGSLPRDYYRSNVSQVTSYSPTQINLAPIYTYPDGTWSFNLYYCLGSQSNGQCNQFNSDSTGINVTLSFFPTPTPAPVLSAVTAATVGTAATCQQFCPNISKTCTPTCYSPDGYPNALASYAVGLKNGAVVSVGHGLTCTQTSLLNPNKTMLQIATNAVQPEYDSVSLNCCCR